MAEPADTNPTLLPREVEAALADLHAAGSYPTLDQVEGWCATYPAAAAHIRGTVKSLIELMDTEHPPCIGPYRVLEVLGEGGMGTVYLVERQEPVKLRAALKVIKLGMDSRAVLARFEQERQALALMQHDGIARVYDCGTTDRGQPYFVMELVRGEALNRFCERVQLSLPLRLQLMRQICDAVQHAHQKGVVHRDLKPSNVLVNDEGGRLQVKVIDFGLAKAMGEGLGEATQFTAAGQVVGTPEYMAPEQADRQNHDIDTRADIYSLGVMLYEILVGELPFSTQDLRKAGFLEMQRMLREQDPPKPSTRLAFNSSSSTAVAAARHMSAGALARALKNDLDWVVLKALEKDRNRRYESANALAADLQRFLDHEPLVAGPPSPAYRLRKLGRKYRSQVLAAGAVLVTAVAGAVVAVGYALTAGENERAASRQAQENGVLAAKNDAVVQEFKLLAAVSKYDRLIAAEERLRPGWPEQRVAIQDWLERDCSELLAMRPSIEATVEKLRRHALPLADAELPWDRQAHPAFAEWQRLTQRVASLRRAQAIRAGALPLEVPALTEAQQKLGKEGLLGMARSRVDPGPEARRLFGQEGLGLAAAEAGLQRAAGTADEYRFLHLLAWALFANGKDTDAMRRMDEALAKAPRKGRAEYASHQAVLRQLIDGEEQALGEAVQRLEQLTTTIQDARPTHFGPEEQSSGFLFESLVGLLPKLQHLATDDKVQVEELLAWSTYLTNGLSRDHPHAQHSWQDARAAIAKADDVVASRLYGGHTIELRDADVAGLVPLGMNPKTRLWEFYDLRSAWDGASDPRELPIPQIAADGSIAMTPDTGIVFVLLPGGLTTLGSQDEDKGAPYYDEHHRDEEVLRLVELSPFLIARHELTRAQWQRLWTWDQDLRKPSHFSSGRMVLGKPILLTNPVEQVGWSSCDLLARRYGMDLPTAAQWEYACRAGTTTPWWPGVKEADLDHTCNINDHAAGLAGNKWDGQAPFDDGYVFHAPVGSFDPNPFGLYDTIGNVSEWCRDTGSEVGSERAGDGLRQYSWGTITHSYRGGGFIDPAIGGRSCAGIPRGGNYSSGDLGMRPVRNLAR